MNENDCEGPALLDFDHISVSYNGRPVLDDISFQVPHGEQVAIVGPNGAGKSTLFKALVGLLPLRGGQIRIHCKPLGSHTDCVAYVPQREEVDWRFPVTVEDVVSMGRYARVRWLGRMTAHDRDVVRRSMDALGVLPLAQRPIGDLSGGQQQRVFLARALAQEPHILLMDEPFTGVDVTTQEVTLRLLETLRQQQVTVMVSTHDLTMASERFPRVLLLNRRLVAYGSPAEALSPDALASAFGKQIFFTGNALLVDQCCDPNEEHHHEVIHD
jgi:ABC-type Mn2+/Zn2+ transport system ATPase subunit